MRTFFILFTKELRSFFLSPMAYVVMALVILLNGWLFSSMVSAMRMRVSPHSLVYNLFDSGWFWMGFIIIFPIITMRLFAEEKKMGTLEGLLTAPVRTSEVVLAKYLATVVTYAVIMLPVFFFFPIFHNVTGEDAAFHSGALWGSALGLLLIGMFNIAIGTLASSLTSNQLIAAMVTFVFVMLHYFLAYIRFFGVIPGSKWLEGISYFSMIDHIHSFSEGLIDTRPIVYYVSFSILMLAFSHHVLESRKWRA